MSERSKSIRFPMGVGEEVKADGELIEMRRRGCRSMRKMKMKPTTECVSEI